MEAQPYPAELLAAKPVEYLYKDQLVRELIIQPYNDLVMLGEASECVLAGFQILPRVLQRGVTGLGHELRTVSNHA
jgi:hypothetical protein